MLRVTSHNSINGLKNSRSLVWETFIEKENLSLLLSKKNHELGKKLKDVELERDILKR